jgi:ATP-binding cassette subfamily F protein 3
LDANPTETLKYARSLLGSFLLRGDDVFKKLSILSGGEKSRVGLCCLMAQKANFLILDEPTNHLDMSSASILAGALADFEGTVLFVSHNRSFIDQVATHIFAMTRDGRGGLFEGKLADYESLALRAGFPNVLKQEGKEPR